jgi:hypothetical protein
VFTVPYEVTKVPAIIDGQRVNNLEERPVSDCKTRP